jgi:hypothetical protein
MIVFRFAPPFIYFDFGNDGRGNAELDNCGLVAEPSFSSIAKLGLKNQPTKRLKQWGFLLLIVNI